LGVLHLEGDEVIDMKSVKALSLELYDSAYLAAVDFLVDHAGPSLQRAAERQAEMHHVVELSEAPSVAEVEASAAEALRRLGHPGSEQ
jgi:ABC-type uncharacterized transport system substrate-binding protein